ncbi:nucleolar protein isoform X2 [Tasmannia lanceolata]|uniref:nucleolar protein isoform X2 n=1 Tax=Tasmannia lanceolata TaxID=3420 RepID=UPI00406427C7
MNLKVDELLKEVQLDSSTVKAIDYVISSIKDAIGTIPDHKVLSDTAPGFIRDLGVQSDKVGFTFKKPKSFDLVGSYSITSVAKPHANVDVLLPMPKECFLEKDYLDHRYHAKRCLYLCVIEKHLKSSPAVRKIEWSTFQNEARKPVLIIYPDVQLVEPFEIFIRLIPAATSLFNVSKLSLTRNNIRVLNQGEGSIKQATPKYNSSILEDMFLEENAAFVKKAFLGWKDLQEALLLLKVWARHRSSIYTHDGLNGFLISFIMSHLATESGGNRINRSMKAMQIFRVTLDFIATSKLSEKGFSLQSLGQCNVLKEERKQHLQSFSANLCDISGHFNLEFRMTRSALIELRDEAAWTLNCMDKCRDGGFEEVFMTKVDFPSKFDYCIRINLTGNSKVYEMGFCSDDECWRVYEEKIHSLLERALTDRAKYVRVTWRSTPFEWNIKDGFSKFGNEQLLAGIMVSSSEKSFRVVDVGPNSENKEEVAKFRKFWGEKAELRRFKDGNIAESTVWECEQWDRHLIIKRIAEHILSRHLSLSNEDMVHVVDQLDFCLLHGVKDPISDSGALTKAFEVLSKRLRSLEDIPLGVSSVKPLDPAFRYTSVFPPEPHPLANDTDIGRRSHKFVTTCIQPLDVMIQLEGSGNWPLDEVALEKTKSAFLLKIGESLQRCWGMTCISSEEEVNVLVSGYAFRLRILHERGMNLIKKQAGNGQTKWIPSLDKELFLRGQHSSMVNGLQGRYPTYGSVVRLAKRWVTSHLFSSFLAEEAIELLVAYLFLKPFPFYAPCSRITGFLRFLELLSSHDWTFFPLIVDINNDLTLEDEKEINENFMSSRKSYGENSLNVDPAMFLATPYDKASEAWTKFSPNTSMLRRMALYARSSAEFLTKLILQGQNGSANRWECVFRTPLNNYDAVILLHRDKLSYPQRLLFPAEMNKGM